MPQLQQETTDPYRLLATCILLNVTRGDSVLELKPELFARWPDAESMAVADPEELAELLRPLGCHRKRAETLRDLAGAILVDPPTSVDDVLALPGCGPYAADSWAMFVDRDLDVSPTDHALRARLAELRA